MGQLNTALFNLAGAHFSEEKMEVLTKGLKFAPDKNLDKLKAFIDIEKYVRKLNIKKHFGSLPNPPSVGTGDQKFVHSRLKNNSVFNPKKGTHHFIEVCKHLIQDDVKNFKIKKYKQNERIWEGIKQLEKKKDIVMRPADKGGRLVILTKKDYNQEVFRLLSDSTTYKKLKPDPTKVKMELTEWVNKGIQRKILDKKKSKIFDPTSS